MNREELLSALRALPPTSRIITALDVPGRDEAVRLAVRLGPAGGFVKVGLELFSAAGPDVVADMKAAGRDVFLDLKDHDIPNTVASAARIAATVIVSETATAGEEESSFALLLSSVLSPAPFPSPGAASGSLPPPAASSAGSAAVTAASASPAVETVASASAGAVDRTRTAARPRTESGQAATLGQRRHRGTRMRTRGLAI